MTVPMREAPTCGGMARAARVLWFGGRDRGSTAISLSLVTQRSRWLPPVVLVGSLLVVLTACSTATPSGSATLPPVTAPPARAASGPIDIDGESNVVIENVHVSNPGGTCINITNSSNVTVRNSTIGPCGDEAVYLSDVDAANISDNYISDTGNGVLIHRSDSIAVDGNAFVNAGRNFVQFDKVNGAGSSISRNRGENGLGGSNAEDFISLYQSNGTQGSPILIVGNHLRNGGPSDSGSGIMVGDGGGAHQIVEANVLVNPGQVGIGVASGSGVIIRDNLIYSDAQPWSNVGLYVWNQYGSTCDDIEVVGNQVNWTAAGGYDNSYWGGGGCSNLSVHDNDWDSQIGPGIF
jgi:parallel beta-helix repeat protein